MRDTTARKNSIALLTLLLLLSMHGAAGAADPPRLALGWYDGFHICSVMTKRIQSTVVDIFARFGVLAFWEDEATVSEYGPEDVPVRVILVDAEPTDWKLRPTTLGVVVKTDVPNTAYIFARRSFRALGYKVPHGVPGARKCSTPRAMSEVSLAMARIIAHELIHVIAPNHPHAEDGLMFGHMDRGRLLRRRLEVDSECVREFLTQFQRRSQGKS